MKDKIIQLIILLGYCIPFSFLSMYGDVTSGTMLFYGIMAICMGGLCYLAGKTGHRKNALTGNILSGGISYICVLQFRTEKWSWYFKPFTETTLVIIISFITLGIQILIWKMMSNDKI